MNCCFAHRMVPEHAAERSRTFIYSQPGVHFHVVVDREVDIWTIICSQVEKSGFSFMHRLPF